MTYELDKCRLHLCQCFTQVGFSQADTRYFDQYSFHPPFYHFSE